MNKMIGWAAIVANLLLYVVSLYGLIFTTVDASFCGVMFITSTFCLLVLVAMLGLAHGRTA